MPIRRTLLISSVMVSLALAPIALSQRATRAELRFQEAHRKETIDGDLKSAIDLYRKAIAEAGANRPIAAQSLVRMGECYEMLGDAQAGKAYERVVREFGDQKDSAEAARGRLAAMGKLASGPTTRLISKDGGIVAPSPDGRFLLQKGTDGELDLRDLQTGQIRRIAKRPWVYAGVSPDGRQVAFTRCSNGACELRTVGTDGSGERLLWQADKDWWAFGVQWFPDSKRIMGTVYQRNGPGRLVAISATDGAAATLWEEKTLNDPQLSPDGKSVVYTKTVRGNPFSYVLSLLRLEDRSEVPLFEGQSIVGSPRWTPDGTGVVFLSDRRLPGTTLDLWLLRTSGGKPLGFPELVKPGLGEIVNGGPSIFAAGPITRYGTYYFHRTSATEMRQLLTTKFDPDTGKAVGASSFVSRKGGESWSPSFSQDGRWLAYVLKSPGSLPSLVIQSAESGEESVVPMTPSSLQLGWAVMFPDGRSVLVNTPLPQGRNGVYRMDVASGAWTSLKKPGEGEVTGWPNGISRDGRTIYLSRYPPGAVLVRLIARDIETGQERDLGNWQGGGVWSLSHDGRQLAVAHPDGKDLVIDVLPASGGPKREVYRVPGYRGADIAWTPDGRYWIVALSDGKAASKLYVTVPVEGGDAQPIGISVSQDGQVQFPRGFGALRILPNGRQLVYTGLGLSDDGVEDWALENFLPKAAK